MRGVVPTKTLVIAAATLVVLLSALVVGTGIILVKTSRVAEDASAAADSAETSSRSAESAAKDARTAIRRVQGQRRESVELLCDQNSILRTFIAAPPTLPRDAPALQALDAERCDKLLSGFEPRAKPRLRPNAPLRHAP